MSFPKTIEEFREHMLAVQAQFARTNVNPPVEERTYILGIIDGKHAVHSVIIGSPGQIHEDFWPVAGTRRWRYAIWAQRLCLLRDAQGKAEYELTDEEREAVRRHLAKKGFNLH